MGQRQPQPPRLIHLTPSQRTYFDTHNDALLGLTYIANGLRSFSTKKLRQELDENEQKTWKDLSNKRRKFADSLIVWAADHKTCYVTMRKRIRPGCITRDVIDGFVFDGQEIAQFKTDLETLKEEHEEFHEDLEDHYKLNRKKWLRISAVTAGIAGLLGCAVLIILHFVPGVNFVLTAVELVLVGAGIFAAGTVIGTAMSKDEVDRALAFLEKVQHQLNNVQEALSTIQGEERSVKTRLNAYQVLELDDVFAGIVANLDRLTGVCKDLL